VAHVEINWTSARRATTPFRNLTALSFCCSVRSFRNARHPRCGSTPPSGPDDALDRLLRPAAKIVDQANLATRLAGKAGVTAVQNQPMMCMQHEFGGNDLLEAELDLERRLARRKTGAIGDAEDVGIDRKRVFAIGHIEHNVGGLSSSAGQRFDLGAG